MCIYMLTKIDKHSGSKYTYVAGKQILIISLVTSGSFKVHHAWQFGKTIK